MRVQRYAVLKAFKGDRDYTPGELINPFENIGRWRNLAALERGGWLKAVDAYPVQPATAEPLPNDAVNTIPPELDDAIRAVFAADEPITETAIGAKMGLSRSHFQRTYLKPRRLTANDLKRRARELDPTTLPGKN